MKRRLSSLLSPLLAAAVVVLLVGCEGPEGPQGPAGQDGADGAQGAVGPQGPQGEVGPAGADGADANENCIQCHTDDTYMYARVVQYGNSVHRNGGNFERNGTSCAACHTHEGFVERLETGSFTTASPENPSPVNCRTCHMIHTTYTDADWMLSTTDAVTLQNGGTFDLGNGNLCASCHQQRSATLPDPTSMDDYTFTSSRFGPHHGGQGDMLIAENLIDITGDVTASFNTHGDVTDNPDGCIGCHMAAPFGGQAGGHTWNLEYDYHGTEHYLVSGCNVTGCHSNNPIDDADGWEGVGGYTFTFAGVVYTGNQAVVHAMIDSLAIELEAAGIYNPATGLANTGDYTQAVAAAYWNFISVEEDRSFGIHSPAYIYQILRETLEALTP